MNENQDRQRKALQGYLPMIVKQMEVIKTNLRKFRTQASFLGWEDIYQFLLLMRYVEQVIAKANKIDTSLLQEDNDQED